MSAVNLDALREWIGRTETRTDVITEAPVAALSASLNHEQSRAITGEALPTCWHWLFFQDVIPTAQLAVDGHPQRGGFLPPVPLPRRMWAGSRLRFVAPLSVGAELSRASTIQSVGHKQGRSGDLIFVTVLHQIYCGASMLLEEEQDLVYREVSSNNSDFKPAPAPQPTPTAAVDWTREVRPDPVLLFRYSALTFNSHRIHYDKDYAMRQEGYEGLVVHGPLTATLLLELLHRELPTAQVAAFEFRAIGPLFEGAVMRLEGRHDGQHVALLALNASGAIAMEARASLAID
jgi:3-methylfumaryl-CoA hydratase